MENNQNLYKNYLDQSHIEKLSTSTTDEDLFQFRIPIKNNENFSEKIEKIKEGNKNFNVYTIEDDKGKRKVKTIVIYDSDELKKSLPKNMNGSSICNNGEHVIHYEWDNMNYYNDLMERRILKEKNEKIERKKEKVKKRIIYGVISFLVTFIVQSLIYKKLKVSNSKVVVYVKYLISFALTYLMTENC